MTDCTLIIDYGGPNSDLGSVWQGGGSDVAMHDFGGFPRERMLVQMASDIPGLQSPKNMRVLFYGIEDGPNGVIPIEQLCSLVDFLCIWLRSDKDLVIGCFLGRSRSTYINAAVMMAMTGWNLNNCLTRIASKRDINVMPCFLEQLSQIENRLRGSIGKFAA